ncbi:MAG: IS66 family insertion sequence element accessory protein TnpA [Anaerolineales bacterium]
MARQGERRAVRGSPRSEAKERFWRGHVSRQAAGRLTIRAYCERHALAEPSFYVWRRELARRDATADRNGRPPAGRPSSRGVPFLQLNVPSPPVVVEIVLTDGTLIRVAAGADEATLAAVLTALAAARAQPC